MCGTYMYRHCWPLLPLFQLSSAFSGSLNAQHFHVEHKSTGQYHNVCSTRRVVEHCKQRWIVVNRSYIDGSKETLKKILQVCRYI